MIYASFIKRSIAFLIDVLVVYFIIKVFYLVLNKSLDFFTWMWFSGILSFIYFIVFWKKFNGKTIGSYLTKIRIVSEDNNPIRFKNAFLRAGALFVFVCPFGILGLILLSELIGTFILIRKSPYAERKQTTWDVAASTYVIDESK